MKVEEGNNSKADLIAHMSHEMRTPLSAILGFAQLMGSGRPSPTAAQKRSIDLILQAGWYLENLINMTGDLALIESGRLSLSLEPVPVDAVMRDCQELLQSQSHTRGVRVSFPVFQTPCYVTADRIRLQKVLGNLLSAAIEHNEVGGAVVVHCETHDAEWVRISVNDRDEELSVARRAQYFEPLDQPQKGTTAVEETRIGLLLAKRLVELMGGAFGAEPIGGTRKEFSFDLKCIRVPTAPSRRLQSFTTWAADDLKG